MITIVLPWPPKQLFPNEAHRRTGAWGYAKKARMLRTLAWGLTVEARGPDKMRRYEPEGDIVLQIELTPPLTTGQAPDEDNVLAALKPARDGISDALGVNDSRFRQAKPVWRERQGNGKVIISWGA